MNFYVEQNPDNPDRWLVWESFEEGRTSELVGDVGPFTNKEDATSFAERYFSDPPLLLV